MFQLQAEVDGLNQIILGIGINLILGKEVEWLNCLIVLGGGEELGFFRSPVDTELWDVKELVDWLVWVGRIGPIKVLFLPLCIRGVDANLSQSQAHREATVEVLKVLKPYVNVSDRDLDIVYDLCDKTLDEALFLLLLLVGTLAFN